MPKRRGKRASEGPKTLVNNAANEEQVRSAKILEKHGRTDDIEDIKVIMESAQGSRFLSRMLRLCGVHQTSVTADADTNTTFFLEGQRNVGLQLLSDLLEANPVVCSDILLKSKEGR